MIQYYIITETVAFYPIAIRSNGKTHITCPLIDLLNEDTLVFNTDNNTSMTLKYFKTYR